MYALVTRALRLLQVDEPAKAIDQVHRPQSKQSLNKEYTVERDEHGRPDQDYFTALSESTQLPPEISSQILDFAEIWYALEMAAHEGPIVRVTNGRLVVAKTPALNMTPLGRRSLRQIVFKMTSKDQGWSSNPRAQHETFDGSYTWFDGFISPGNDHSSTPSESHNPVFELQRNVHAGTRFATYAIPITPGHALFDLISPGCSINLQACAHFPGWVNNVAHASIEMHFADTFNHRTPVYFT